MAAHIDPLVPSVPSFPQALRNELLRSPEQDGVTDKIQNLLHHPEVRDQFFKWAQKHQGMVGNNSRLRNIYRLIQEEKLEDSLGSSRFTQMYHVASSLFSTAQGVKSWVNGEASNYIPYLTEYVEAGLFDAQKCRNLLVKFEVVPALKKLPPEMIKEVLTIKDSQGNALIHDGKSLLKILPLLEKLPPEMLKEVVTTKNSKGAALIHNDDTFSQILPLLEKLPPEMLKELLTTKNSKGVALIHYDEPLLKILPLLEKLPPEMLKEVVTTKNSKGAALIHYDEPLLKILPLLEKLPPEMLKEVVTTKDSQGNALIHYDDTFSQILSLLEKLPPEMLKELLTTKNSKGNVLIHDGRSLLKILPLLEKLPPEMLKEVVTTKDSQGYALIHDSNSLSKILPLLEKLPPEMLKEVVTTKNSKGYALIHDINSFSQILPLLEKLSPEMLKEVLTTKGPQGIALIHYGNSLSKILPLLEKLPPEMFKEVVTTKNSQGHALIHFDDTFSQVLQGLSPNKLGLFLLLNISSKASFLNNSAKFEIVFFRCLELSPGALFELFKVQDHNGRTILHYFDYNQENHSNLYKYLSNKLSREHFDEIMSLRDKWHLSVSDLHSLPPMAVSSTWLSRAKIAIKPISREAYNTRATQLEEQVLDLWKNLSFGLGKTEGLIDIRQFHTGKIDLDDPDLVAKLNQTVDSTETALKVILSKLKEQRAWLGTSPAGEKDALHVFYSDDLYNLEKIVAYVRSKNNPEVTAGYLFRIALPEKENRCAAGYKDEFRQVATTIDIEEGKADLSVDSLFRAALSQSLSAVNEEIIREFGNDSHYSAHLQYLTGFSTVPDHLLEEEKKQILLAVLKSKWTLPKVLEAGAEALNKMDPTLLDDWLVKKATPFGPEAMEVREVKEVKGVREVKGMKESAMATEEGAKETLRTNLEEVPGLSKEERQAIFSFCTSISGSSFRYGDPLSDEIRRKISTLSKEEQNQLYDPNTEILAMQMIFSEKNLLPKEIGARRAFQKELGQLHGNNQLKLALKEKLKIADPTLLEKIMKIKDNYDRPLREFANDNDIPFVPGQHATLSAAIKAMEKQVVFEKFYNETTGRLSIKAVQQFLIDSGVVESIAT